MSLTPLSSGQGSAEASPDLRGEASDFSLDVGTAWASRREERNGWQPAWRLAIPWAQQSRRVGLIHPRASSVISQDQTAVERTGQNLVENTQAWREINDH